jgi:hypothetical protein
MYFTYSCRFLNCAVQRVVFKAPSPSHPQMCTVDTGICSRLCWTLPFRGPLEGVGPVNLDIFGRIARCHFSAQNSRDFQGPHPSNGPRNRFARIKSLRPAPRHKTTTSTLRVNVALVYWKYFLSQVQKSDKYNCTIYIVPIKGTQD